MILKPGLRETQVAAIGDMIMKFMGAQGYGFETIVNSGERVRTIIGPAENKIIKEGEIVQLGVSPSFDGYKGVCRRSVVMGKPNNIQKLYFYHLKTAFLKAKKALKKAIENNLEPKLVDLAAREYLNSVKIDGYSLGNYHTYSSAHGTGLTECLEGKPINPDTVNPLGKRIGIMLDVGCYGHPNPDIPGGCIENAFAKNGNKFVSFPNLPVNAQSIVGEG